MIYTEAFDALPAATKATCLRTDVGASCRARQRNREYSRLSAADRRAIVEILRETKKDLPPYFKSG